MKFFTLNLLILIYLSNSKQFLQNMNSLFTNTTTNESNTDIDIPPILPCPPGFIRAPPNLSLSMLTSPCIPAPGRAIIPLQNQQSPCSPKKCFKSLQSKTKIPALPAPLAPTKPVLPSIIKYHLIRIESDYSNNTSRS